MFYLSSFLVSCAHLFPVPIWLWLIVCTAVLCAQIARRYLGGARSIKRLESIQKSPMISHFGSSLEGLSTIRAFSNSPVFINRAYGLIDSFSVATWHSWLFNGWVGFRMAMVGSIFSSSVAAFVVSTRGVDASLAGFALAFALDYRNAAIRAIRLLASTELDMNAAERIFEYSNLETEPQGGIDNLRASWPEEGKLEVKDLEVGYAADLPSILKGLTFTAASNQRIGVVGRTGAGMSGSSLSKRMPLLTPDSQANQPCRSRSSDSSKPEKAVLSSMESTSLLSNFMTCAPAWPSFRKTQSSSPAQSARTSTHSTSFPTFNSGKLFSVSTSCHLQTARPCPKPSRLLQNLPLRPAALQLQSILTLKAMPMFSVIYRRQFHLQDPIFRKAKNNFFASHAPFSLALDLYC